MVFEKKVMLSNIVLIRVFASLMVVLGHSMVFYYQNWGIFEPPVESPFFHTLRTFLSIFTMPLFLFVSGYIYNYNKIERNKHSVFFPFLKLRITRLIVPFLLVLTLYVLPIRLFVGYEPYQGESLLSILFNQVILGRDVGHLWFLQALFIIFIIFFFIEKVVRKTPFLVNFAVLFVISVFASLVPDVFNISATFQYFIFFYLGYFMREALGNREYNINNIGLVVLFIISFSGVIFTNIFENNSIIISGMTLGFNLIGSLSAVFFFYFSFTKISNKYNELAEGEVLKFLDKRSFGIYLFHSPILYIVLYYIGDKMINPFVMVLILYTLMVCGSLLIASLLLKSNVLSIILGKTYKRGNKKTVNKQEVQQAR